MTQTTTYDIIFAGAGLSGLTLALELARRPAFREKKMLLVDRDHKQQNDRTWCFWASDDEPLPPVVYQSWDRCRFFSPEFETVMDISPYRYRMVRGIDFYNWAKNELKKYPNIDLCAADITGIDAERGLVQTSVGEFSATHVFNSAFTKTRILPKAGAHYPNPPLSVLNGTSAEGSPPNHNGHSCLLQHFKGWMIETADPVFDPAAMTFMDFRIPQHGQTRFVYVLPFSPTRALVEFTVFSPALLNMEEYKTELQGYIQNFLKINRFEILEEEFGVIPMTDIPFPNRAEGRVIHIGTAGGFVKASRGYAFKRTQRKCRAFADAWERNGRPDPAFFRSTRTFRIFDSIFLRVLANRNELGGAVFTDLFRKLPPDLVLRFLDEDSTFAENFRLVNAPQRRPFWQAMLQQIPNLHRI